MTICHNCRKTLRDGAKFCDNCGVPVAGTPVSAGSHSAPAKGPFASLLSGFTLNLSAKTVKRAVSAVAVILVLIILISVIVPSSDNNSFAYIKDDEMYYSTVSNAKGKQATTDLLDNSTSIGDIDDLVRLSDDGKRLFFIDKYDGSGYDLYFKKTSSLKKASEKITSDVNIYDINDKGTLVTYIKDGGKLYQHNLKEQSDKIDENVMSFVASDNGKRIVYLKVQSGSDTYALDIYLSKSGKAGEKVVTGVESIKYLSKDLKTVYFTNSNELFKVKIGNEPEKISDGIRDVIKVYDSGELYFVKDAGDSTSTLFYYDGKKEPVAIANNFYSSEDYAEDTPALVFYAENSKEGAQSNSYCVAVKDEVSALEYDISSIDMDPAGDEIYFIADADSQSGIGDLYRAKLTGREIKAAEKQDAEVFSGSFVADGKYLYVKNYDSSDSTGEVYLNGKLVGEDVYWQYINYSDENDTLVFFTDVDEKSNATLNVFKGSKAKKVMDDVYMYSLSIVPKGELLFIGDFDNGDGTLYICKNKKAKKVDDEVSSVIRFATNEEFDTKTIANF